MLSLPGTLSFYSFVFPQLKRISYDTGKSAPWSVRLCNSKCAFETASKETEKRNKILSVGVW